jgi:hypothetical protein
VRALPVLVAATAFVAAGALALHELRAGTPAQTATVVAASPPAAQAEPPASLPPPPPRTVDARPQIQRAIQAAPALKTMHDLEGYLSDLEARARRNHQLTALEVEPGLAAIRQMSSELDPQRAFELETEYVQRMNRLAAELAPPI